MVTLEKIRIDLEKQLSVDKEINSVDVLAYTIEEALADAAVQLETTVPNLEYEVLEKGFPGVMGLARKPWKLRIYENPKVVQQKKQAAAAAASLGGQMEEEEKIVDTDGLFYVRHFGSSIFLKVVLPVGNGKPVEVRDVFAEARRADTLSLDEDKVKTLCSTGTENGYVNIGEYKHESAGDALLAVDVARDEMKATITVSPPGMSGAEISADSIEAALKLQGVVAGIDKQKISDFVDNPSYNVPYEVATAVMPVDGRDAYISYNFETDRSKLRLKETDTGQIDFKELNLIQNVVAGQPLAQKMLPQRGKIGQTIMGRMLEAKNGKDIPIPLGANVHVDTDGVTVVADKNGQVMLVGDKITVEEVYEVPGVNIKTGNITFMGTVVCRGNVEDGFNIKADGNIEIYGSVGNCKIEAEGDIVISQGVMGRDEGEIRTPKNVWARFIQNATVDAGEDIVVNDNIMNSNVTAMHKILLKGKRAQIIGGHLFATEEISAKNIGAGGGGTETILEVGVDPKKKQRLMELQELQASIVKELEEVDLNISTLENQKKIRKSLPKEKEESLKKFIARKNEIIEINNGYSTEINQIQERLRELKVVGRVNASGTVYPGVKVFVRDEKDEVKNEVKAVSFFYDNGFVRRGKYDPSQVTDQVRDPDGYSSN